MCRDSKQRLMARRIAGLVRGGVVLVVAGALIGFLFDTAVHSVHHLDGSDEAPPCSIALIAGCLGVATPAPISLAPPARRALGVLPTIIVRVDVDAQVDVDRDRAPPIRTPA
jgi:hypothetical protein